MCDLSNEELEALKSDIEAQARALDNTIDNVTVEAGAYDVLDLIDEVQQCRGMKGGHE